METAKNMDIVLIGLLRTFHIPDLPLGTINHLTFCRLTNLPKTKVLGYLNARHQELLKLSINRSGTVTTITIAFTRVLCVYLGTR